MSIIDRISILAFTFANAFGECIEMERGKKGKKGRGESREYGRTGQGE